MLHLTGLIVGFAAVIWVYDPIIPSVNFERANYHIYRLLFDTFAIQTTLILCPALL